MTSPWLDGDCVLCPQGLGAVCPFAWPLVALWLLPSCPRAPSPVWQRGCAVSLPALFPILALYDGVGVLVVA